MVYYQNYPTESVATKSFLVDVIDNCPTYPLSIDPASWLDYSYHIRDTADV